MEPCEVQLCTGRMVIVPFRPRVNMWACAVYEGELEGQCSGLFYSVVYNTEALLFFLRDGVLGRSVSEG